MKNSPDQKLYAVVGDPVAHSLSPLIHTGWIEAAGLNARYTRVHLQSDHAADDIRAMARDYAGLNVTLPHKIAALKAAATASPEARLIGAANTLVPAGAGWMAHNTDVAGFETALHAALNRDAKDLDILLIGAGGAARAAVFSLARVNARLTLANRSVDNAAALARDLAPGATVASLDQVDRLSETADIVINSASFGHSGGALPPLAPGSGRPFLDLSYGKAAAPVLTSAQQAGWTPHDGLPMLVAQAAAAFHLWFGIHPDEASALAACRGHIRANS